MPRFSSRHSGQVAAPEAVPVPQQRADQRQVIELAYFGGFTHSEIAQMLELPPGTVKGRMRLGLTKMRHHLGEEARATL